MISSHVDLTLTSNQAGQQATEVVLDGWDGPTQHSGFFRFVAERDGATPTANTFFWFVVFKDKVGIIILFTFFYRFLPSLDENPDAPVLLWLQGGPG